MAWTICYQVNYAWTVDRTNRQWIDLGNHAEACMTQPETCGHLGGSTSVWMKLIDCPSAAGIISSFGSSTGSLIGCKNGEIQ